MIGTNFGSVKLKRNNQVVKSHNIFEYLKYELAPVPPSIFDKVSMRETVKSKIIDVVKSINPFVETPLDLTFVVDGGLLLYTILYILTQHGGVLLYAVKPRHLQYVRST